MIFWVFFALAFSQTVVDDLKRVFSESSRYSSDLFLEYFDDFIDHLENVIKTDPGHLQMAHDELGNLVKTSKVELSKLKEDCLEKLRERSEAVDTSKFQRLWEKFEDVLSRNSENASSFIFGSSSSIKTVSLLLLSAFL